MKSFLSKLALLLFASSAAMAQSRTVTGVITDKMDGAPLAGVSIVVKGTSSGTTTNSEGKFSVQAPSSATTLVVSFIGFKTQEVAIPESNNIELIMENDVQELSEVVVTVGRGAQRTVTDTPLPVDNFTNHDLATTGQITFDKALQYRVPSFNSVNTPVNDATTLLDPYEIRNLGPSRTLILINGKRKNLSSLLYVQFAPGRGETGADLSSIPTDAIKRVEILRDGASAQYGSDAIAGVMNVILKDKYEYSTLNFRSGVTSKGDGGMYGLSLNSGGNFAGNGYFNYTVEFNQQNNAVRSGKIDVLTEIATFGNYTGPNSASDPSNANIVNFLATNPTGGNLNGTGETSAARFVYNLGIPINDHAKVYSNAAFGAKRVLSNANYRVPYWKKDYGLLHTTVYNKPNYTGDNTLDANGDQLYAGYVGYMPTFEGNLTDYNATLGIQNENNGWSHDISFTVGGNSQLYTVDNTVNHFLKEKSPTSFKPGGYNFRHIVGNIDVSKQVTEKLFVGFGSEARRETYQIIAGDTSSTSGEGSNSFPGIRADNARTSSRFNLGGYLDLGYDITDKLLIQGTVRGEKYSDFGTAFVWKLTSRLKLLEDKIVLRGSASTGFRAPTLHQIYAQSTQASFAGGTIVLSGLFNNISKQAFALGIPRLKAEKSTNYTVGLGLNPMENLSVTLDYYDITISDRIVYSSSIDPAANTGVYDVDDPTYQLKDKELAVPKTELGRVLKGNTVGQGKGKYDLASVQFFINGVKTKTSGLDIVVSYKNLGLGSGTLGINLAGNINTQNKIIGNPNDPDAIKSAGATILNRQVKSLLTEGRPKYKTILGLDYAVNKLNIVLNNTLFGPTKFQDLDNGGSIMNNIKQEFKPAVVTDLNVGYSFSKSVSASITVNNIFNVLPKWTLKSVVNPDDPESVKETNKTAAQAVLDNPVDRQLLEGFLEFSGRYRILGYNGSQFSQLGTVFFGQLTVKF
jgi:iron complex outermembrane receptor protein